MHWNGVVMYGVGVSAPTSPWGPKDRPNIPGLEPQDLLTLLNPQAATKAELEALTKRVEALEQAMKPKKKRKKRGKKARGPTKTQL